MNVLGSTHSRFPCPGTAEVFSTDHWIKLLPEPTCLENDWRLKFNKNVSWFFLSWLLENLNHLDTTVNQVQPLSSTPFTGTPTLAQVWVLLRKFKAETSLTSWTRSNMPWSLLQALSHPPERFILEVSRQCFSWGYILAIALHHHQLLHIDQIMITDRTSVFLMLRERATQRVWLPNHRESWPQVLWVHI